MESLQRLLTQKPVILQLLRFVAIGVLNTALDFIILNFISKTLGITAGLSLGTINVIGFAAAVVQSYYWNRHWTFDAAQTMDVLKNFVRLIVVGGIGAIGFLAVIAGARMGALPIYYVIILAIFIVAEVAAWMGFGLGKQVLTQTAPGQPALPVTAQTHQFLTFLLVSVIGLVINSALIAVVSIYLANSDAFGNPDLLKNAAKIAATFVSLVWNFVAYKLIVFKK